MFSHVDSVRKKKKMKRKFATGHPIREAKEHPKTEAAEGK